MTAEEIEAVKSGGPRVAQGAREAQDRGRVFAIEAASTASQAAAVR